jgi:hypothetical protein
MAYPMVLSQHSPGKSGNKKKFEWAYSMAEAQTGYLSKTSIQHTS